MQFQTLLFASFASLAVAATTTTMSSGGYKCDAQNIVDACSSTSNAQIRSCSGNDWDCLCTNYQLLLRCYDNCPGSPDASPIQNQVTQYCNAASAYGTMYKTTTASGTAPTGVAPAVTSPTTGSRTTTASANAPTNTGGAATLEVGSGMLALIFAGFGLLI